MKLALLLCLGLVALTNANSYKNKNEDIDTLKKLLLRALQNDRRFTTRSEDAAKPATQSDNATSQPQQKPAGSAKQEEQTPPKKPEQKPSDTMVSPPPKKTNNKTTESKPISPPQKPEDKPSAATPLPPLPKPEEKPSATTPLPPLPKPEVKPSDTTPIPPPQKPEVKPSDTTPIPPPPKPEVKPSDTTPIPPPPKPENKPSDTTPIPPPQKPENKPSDTTPIPPPQKPENKPSDSKPHPPKPENKPSDSKPQPPKPEDNSSEEKSSSESTETEELVELPDANDRVQPDEQPHSIPIHILAFIMSTPAMKAAPLEAAELAVGIQKFGVVLHHVVKTLRQVAEEVKKATSLDATADVIGEHLEGLAKFFIPAQRRASAGVFRLMVYGLEERPICDLDEDDVTSCVAKRLQDLSKIIQKPPQMDPEVNKMPRCNQYVSDRNGGKQAVAHDLDCIADSVSKLLEDISKMKNTLAELQLTSLLDDSPIPRLPLDMEDVAEEVSAELQTEFKSFMAITFRLMTDARDLGLALDSAQ